MRPSTVTGPVITVDAHGATYVNGQRIPKERELFLYGGPNDTYQEKLEKWTQSRCREPGDQGSFCDAAEQLGWISFETKGDILEVLGIRDAIRCAKGSAMGCAWVVGGWLPVGKAIKFAKAGKAAKAADDLCNSFVGGTLVLLADGTRKPIEDLRIGDRVLATDPETGGTRAEKVTAEITGKGKKGLVRITLHLDGKNGFRTASVTATEGHPFWVPELSEWVDAANLVVG